MSEYNDHKNDDMRTIVSVVVDKALFSFDKPFDYILSDDTDAVIGQRVVVPFGKGGKKKVGLIVDIRRDIPDNRLKEVFCLVND